MEVHLFEDGETTFFGDDVEALRVANLSVAPN